MAEACGVEKKSVGGRRPLRLRGVLGFRTGSHPISVDNVPNRVRIEHIEESILRLDESLRQRTCGLHGEGAAAETVNDVLIALELLDEIAQGEVERTGSQQNPACPAARRLDDTHIG